MKRNLTRNERIRTKSDFKNIFATSDSRSCRGAKILFLKNGRNYSRFGVTFQRNFGNAVQRNWSKRIFREIYRNSKNNIKDGFDILFILYRGNFVFSEREEQFFLLIDRADLAENH